MKRDWLETALRKHNARIRKGLTAHQEKPTAESSINVSRIATEAWEQLRWEIYVNLGR